MSELVTLTNKLKKKDMVMWKDLSEEFSILKWGGEDQFVFLLS